MLKIKESIQDIETKNTLNFDTDVNENRKDKEEYIYRSLQRPNFRNL